MSFQNPNTQYLFIKPPIRGAFPMDHDGLCQDIVKEFLACVRSSGNTLTPECREVAARYMQCRMDNELMDREPLSNLGFRSPQGG